MHWPLHFVLAVLVACSGPEEVPDGRGAVQVVDRSGQPVPRAVVWSVAKRDWKTQGWIPLELVPYCGNPHELVRRLGARHEADEFGVVRVPWGAVLAGEAEGLAGMGTIGSPHEGGRELILDSWRWTIVVRDGAGQPAVGVPVSCLASDAMDGEGFQGILLGLTDAAGRLVVQDPASVEVEHFRRPSAEVLLDADNEPVGVPLPLAEQEEPLPVPEFVLFEVDGMYLAPHAGKLRFAERETGVVTLTMPSATRVDVRGPEWRGPVGALCTLTRVGTGQRWDDVVCWLESGRNLALVGVDHPEHPTPISAVVEGTNIQRVVEVPRLPADQVLRIDLELGEGDTIVRARIHDAAGRPASHCLFHVRPSGDGMRSLRVRADREGRVALILRSALSRGADFSLEAYAGPDPQQWNKRARLHVPRFEPGRHFDVGVVEMAR